MNFFERLAARSTAIDSLVCVGLDPEFARHDVSALAAHNREIIEATVPYAACYKPNIAFYEQYGIAGLKVLEETLAAIPDEIPVIGDVKRGDIGSTAAAYARAMFREWRFDAVTLNPYLGRDSLDPFFEYEDKGFYIVCRTSNPGAADLQYLPTDDGRLFETVALLVTKWSDRAGLVVGATAPSEMRDIRALVPDAPFLVPGVGAQGGRPEEVVAAAGWAPGKLLVSASRSIYYAADGETAGWGAAAGHAAKQLRDELNAARTPETLAAPAR